MECKQSWPRFLTKLRIAIYLNQWWVIFLGLIYFETWTRQWFFSRKIHEPSEWNCLSPGSRTGSPESAAGVGSPTWKSTKKKHQDCHPMSSLLMSCKFLSKVQSGSSCFKKHAYMVVWLWIMNPILSITEIIWVRFHLAQASCSSSESMACKPLLSPSNLICVPWIQQKAWEDIRSHTCTKSCHPKSVAWSSIRFIIDQSISTKKPKRQSIVSKASWEDG